MIIKTKRFGTIDIDKESVLYFPEGLVFRPELKRFVLFKDTSRKNSRKKDWDFYAYLISIETEDFELPLYDVLKAKNNYSKSRLTGVSSYKVGISAFDCALLGNRFQVLLAYDGRHIDEGNIFTGIPICVNREKRIGVQCFAGNYPLSIDAKYAFKLMFDYSKTDEELSDPMEIPADLHGRPRLELLAENADAVSDKCDEADEPDDYFRLCDQYFDIMRQIREELLQMDYHDAKELLEVPDEEDEQAFFEFVREDFLTYMQEMINGSQMYMIIGKCRKSFFDVAGANNKAAQEAVRERQTQLDCLYAEMEPFKVRLGEEGWEFFEKICKDYRFMLKREKARFFARDLRDYFFCSSKEEKIVDVKEPDGSILCCRMKDAFSIGVDVYLIYEESETGRIIVRQGEELDNGVALYSVEDKNLIRAACLEYLERSERNNS